MGNIEHLDKSISNLRSNNEILTKGYQTRLNKLRGQFATLVREISKERNLNEVYCKLYRTEVQASLKRILDKEDLLSRVQKKVAYLQEKHKALTEKLTQLKEL